MHPLSKVSKPTPPPKVTAVLVEGTVKLLVVGVFARKKCVLQCFAPMVFVNTRKVFWCFCGEVSKHLNNQRFNPLSVYCNSTATVPAFKARWPTPPTTKN